MTRSIREPQALSAIQLPFPEMDRSASLFTALQQRKTTREISEAPLPLQLLSNLLWAAWGVNRGTGLIAGNVYLFVAAHGLAAWFHNCDKTGLGQRLGLRAEQRVLFAQSIGYPEKL